MRQLIEARLDRLGKPAEPVRRLFVGQLEWNKGCRYALDALPLSARALERPLEFTVAGEGSERPGLERRSRRLADHRPAIQVNCTGWVGQDRLRELFTNTDLLLVPSLWPERFGLVGLEAALFGVPTAAFAIGGMPDWLADGQTGALAPGDPATVEGLAEAAVRCLKEAKKFRRLGQMAQERTGNWPEMPEHGRRIEAVFTYPNGLSLATAHPIR